MASEPRLSATAAGATRSAALPSASSVATGCSPVAESRLRRRSSASSWFARRRGSRSRRRKHSAIQRARCSRSRVVVSSSSGLLAHTVNESVVSKSRSEPCASRSRSSSVKPSRSAGGEHGEQLAQGLLEFRPRRGRCDATGLSLQQLDDVSCALGR